MVEVRGYVRGSLGYVPMQGHRAAPTATPLHFTLVYHIVCTDALHALCGEETEMEQKHSDEATHAREKHVGVRKQGRAWVSTYRWVSLSVTRDAVVVAMAVSFPCPLGRNLREQTVRKYVRAMCVCVLTHLVPEQNVGHSSDDDAAASPPEYMGLRSLW